MLRSVDWYFVINFSAQTISPIFKGKSVQEEEEEEEAIARPETSVRNNHCTLNNIQEER
jgi:hypothetical protein